MAGVTGPMLRRSRAQGVRFLAGLAVGGVVASTLLATAIWLLGLLLQLVVPLVVRAALAVVAVVIFGVADLLNRTPHVWRQVPQRFVRVLPPGRLGVVWGFDLSLLFTTQKSTSLTWAVLAVLVLLSPHAAGLILICMTMFGVLAVVVRSVIWSRITPAPWGDRARPWFPMVRRAAGALLLVVAALMPVGGSLT
jgi:hypothetical protein